MSRKVRSLVNKSRNSIERINYTLPGRYMCGYVNMNTGIFVLEGEIRYHTLKEMSFSLPKILGF